MTDDKIKELMDWLEKQVYSSPPSDLKECLDYSEVLQYLPAKLKELNAGRAINNQTPSET